MASVKYESYLSYVICDSKSSHIMICIMRLMIMMNYAQAKKHTRHQQQQQQSSSTINKGEANDKGKGGSCQGVKRKFTVIDPS